MARYRLLAVLVPLVVLFAFAIDSLADTVYLKNGSWIDGIVKTHGDDSVVVEIGDLGKVEIPLEDVYRVEKNSRTGSKKRVSVEGRKLDLGPAGNATQGAGDEGSETGAKDPKSAGTAGDVSAQRGEVAGERSASTTPKPAADDSSAEQVEDESAEADERDSGADPVDAGEDPGGASPAGGDTGDVDPELRKRIEGLIADLQREKPNYRVRAERHLRAVGAPAIPFLLPLAKNDSELVRVAAFRLLSDFGDDRAIDAAIDALTDSNEFVREHAHRALRRITHEDFGYKPFASPRHRENRADRWRRWWDAEKALLEELREDR